MKAKAPAGGKFKRRRIARTIGVRSRAAPSLAKEGGNDGAEQDHERKQSPSVAATPARHMQCGPCEEAGLVEDERNDDQRDKGEGRIPDDTPNDTDITPVDNAGQERDSRTAKSGPTDTEALRLPDDEKEVATKIARASIGVGSGILVRGLVDALRDRFGALDPLGIAIRQVSRPSRVK